MKTTVSSKGQIVLPAELRQQDGIEAGQEFAIERLDRGEYRIVRRSPRPNDGVLDWLRTSHRETHGRRPYNIGRHQRVLQE
jgi:AbrB family looped-hinge helix DNA binding protein